jgi:formimidoylglutamate deiminase
VQTPRTGTAITKALHFRHLLLPDGWAERVRLGIANGAFVHIERGVDPQPDDECVALGVPGLCNLHSHAFQRALAGLTEFRSRAEPRASTARGAGPDSFWSWREQMYRFLARITPDQLEAITAQAYVEMLESGFTRVGEFHYLHHGPGGAPYADRAELSARIVAAAHAAGIGLTLLPVFYAHAGFGGADPEPSQARFVLDLDQYAALLEASWHLVSALPHARVGVAPHSLRAVTPSELTRLLPLAQGGPIHLHVAEQLREVQQCLAWSQQRPVEWLLNGMPIDRSWCLVHATHLSDSELTRLAQSGAVAGLCPITEANLGDGVFPAAAYLDAGGTLGVGSDSNVGIAANDELRLLEYGQRLAHGARNVLASKQHSSGRTLFDAACSGGAQALGVAAGVQLGAPADLVALRPEHSSLIGRSGDAWLDSWIFARAHDAIEAVWSNGVKVVAEGRHHARDAVAARYAQTLSTLLRG